MAEIVIFERDLIGQKTKKRLTFQTTPDATVQEWVAKRVAHEMTKGKRSGKEKRDAIDAIFE